MLSIKPCLQRIKNSSSKAPMIMWNKHSKFLKIYLQNLDPFALDRIEKNKAGHSKDKSACRHNLSWLKQINFPCPSSGWNHMAVAGHNAETEDQICLSKTKQMPQLPQVSNFAAQFYILKSNDTFFTAKLAISSFHSILQNYLALNRKIKIFKIWKL